MVSIVNSTSNTDSIKPIIEKPTENRLNAFELLSGAKNEMINSAR